MANLFNRLTVATTIMIANTAVADPARIEAATATASGGDWTFAVTLSHGDTGWDDYADGWRVVQEDGTVLGTRTLLHPHVNEQPFTRSLSGVMIPDGVEKVFIEASTNVEGWDDYRFLVSIR